MSPEAALFMFVLGELVTGCTPEHGSKEKGHVETAALLTTTSFQDGVAPTAGYSGTRDTMLEQDNASTNHGSDKKLSVSGDTPAGSGKDDVALLQWDLSSAIPRTAIVHAATITLTVTDKADQPYALFEMLRGSDEAEHERRN